MEASQRSEKSEDLSQQSELAVGQGSPVLVHVGDVRWSPTYLRWPPMDLERA